MGPGRTSRAWYFQSPTVHLTTTFFSRGIKMCTMRELASYLEGSPLMWTIPLQVDDGNGDDDDDDDVDDEHVFSIFTCRHHIGSFVVQNPSLKSPQILLFP